MGGVHHHDPFGRQSRHPGLHKPIQGNEVVLGCDFEAPAALNKTACDHGQGSNEVDIEVRRRQQTPKQIILAGAKTELGVREITALMKTTRINLKILVQPAVLQPWPRLLPDRQFLFGAEEQIVQLVGQAVARQVVSEQLLERTLGMLLQADDEGTLLAERADEG